MATYLATYSRSYANRTSGFIQAKRGYNTIKKLIVIIGFYS